MKKKLILMIAGLGLCATLFVYNANSYRTKKSNWKEWNGNGCSGDREAGCWAGPDNGDL